MRIAVVSTFGSDYDAVVSYVGATASENNGLNQFHRIKPNGFIVKFGERGCKGQDIKSRRKIVIGFDVDIKVNTEKITNVLKIPVDAGGN